MAYFDNTTPALPVHEEVMLRGFKHEKELEQLNKQLQKAILKASPYHARLRAITIEAAKREPGTPLRDALSLTATTPSFKNPRRVLEIDELLQPFYGNITPALGTLQTFGVERPITDFWLSYFMKDNAIYRVNVVACLVTSGALMCAGIETRVGTPTKLAASAGAF